MGTTFTGSIFSWQTEGIPPHRVKHLIARRTPAPRNHITHRIVTHVANMDTPGRIREHFQDIAFGARWVGRTGLEQFSSVPTRTLAWFCFAVIVTCSHERPLLPQTKWKR
jgi:hypothetical protein